MKLLYVYFDFTQNGTNPGGYRGYKTCELNFGTVYQYHMVPPTHCGQTYVLSQNERPEDEKIVPGFWGDERIYNISALVGDNGSGKSMLIHEIIRCLMTSFHDHMTFENLEEPQYPFVFVTENANGSLYLITSKMNPTVSGFPDDYERISLPVKQTLHRSSTLNWGLTPPFLQDEYGVLRHSKMIYFSNALTMADKTQYSYWNYYEHTDPRGYSVNSQYVSPMYDCSLIADMCEAIKTSKSGMNTLDGYLDTYFNFRSYQEARYVFDRNQRKILLQLRDELHLPVPLPKSLKISIINPLHISGAVYRRHEDDWWHSFLTYCDNLFHSDALRAVIALSMNCILSYCKSENKDFLEDIWPKYKRQAVSLPEDNFFSAILKYCKNTHEKRPSDYYEICQRYLDFLDSSTPLIEKFFNFRTTELNEADRIVAEISLGDIIDPQLEEFMIRFINLTRAVSKHQYFVVYNWGLSSGESNLLHLFTKLRYALSGNIFDAEKKEEYATEKTGTNPHYIKRKEKLLTRTNDITLHDCDSIILFIDEADLTYHPEWQRQFVSIITEFLPRVYTDPYYEGSGSGCKEIQVILSTHSPLMLGDFPSAGVTYLQKHPSGTNEIDTQRHVITFGENLYTILRDSFYLQKGTIGEFAQRKIQQVLTDTSTILKAKKKDTLKDWTTDLLIQKLKRLEEHEKKVLRYLAPGIIRNKLEEEINSCRQILCDANHEPLPKTLQDKNYEARIQQLEREKDLLERKLDAIRRKSEASE